MRIKNLGGGQWGSIKKIDSVTLETEKNHLIRNFLRDGRERVKNYNRFQDILSWLNLWNFSKLTFQFSNFLFILTSEVTDCCKKWLVFR